MKVNTLTLTELEYPDPLRNISSPPEPLYWTGTPWTEIKGRPRVAVVGSRRITNYGRKITENLVAKLCRAGIVIISGLAFGVDAYAHSEVIRNRGTALVVLPSPIESIAPKSHYYLAKSILDSGGVLVSEYPASAQIHKGNFVVRNRIVSGLADIILITEAVKKSGSLHTARFALEQGKTVMAVPGNVDSPSSEGTNNLIKSGALPVTDVNDVFFALGLKAIKPPKTKVFSGTPEQQTIMDLLSVGVYAQEELAVKSKLSGSDFGSTLTSLEIQGYIRPLGGGNWTAS